MNKILKIIAIMCLPFLATACSTQLEKSPAQNLIELINSNIERGKIMIGHQDDPAYGYTWKFEEDRSDMLEVVGDYPAVMGWDLGRIEFRDSVNLDGVPFDFMRREIIKQHQRGGINTLSWHAFTTDGGDSWVKGDGFVTSILPGGENYDKFQDHLACAAEFLGSLVGQDGTKVPVIWRPWHEHDGSWFWWGEKRCTHQEFKELWNMTYDFMQARGLDNLVWAYMPMTGLDEKMPEVERYDMFGIDTYQYSEDNSKYVDELSDKIKMLESYGERFDKPIAITEIGYEGVPYEKWWTEVLLKAIDNRPISYVLMWRNAWDKPGHFYAPYKGHLSEGDFKEFAKKENIIFAKEVNNK